MTDTSISEQVLKEAIEKWGAEGEEDYPRNRSSYNKSLNIALKEAIAETQRLTAQDFFTFIVDWEINNHICLPNEFIKQFKQKYGVGA